MPVYEDAYLFEKTIKSLLRQRNVKLNIFVSDDSRTSNIEKCVLNLSDSRILYSRNQATMGLARNSNHLLNNVCDEWFKFQHQDDVLTDEYVIFDLLKVAMIHPHAGFIFGKVDVIGTPINKQRGYIDINKILRLGLPICLLSNNFIGSVSNIIINARMKNVKWDYDLKYYLDVDYYVKIFDKPIFIPREVNKSYHGSDFQITTTLRRQGKLKAKEAFYILDREKKFINDRISTDIFTWLFPISPLAALKFYYKNNLKMVDIRSAFKILMNLMKYYVAKKEIN